jgi:hypothetical protein
METATTLAAEIRTTTAEHLGPDADALDLVAYREALTRAWPSAGKAELDEDARAALVEAVLEGRAGLDDEGRDWVRVAATRRDEVAP